MKLNELSPAKGARKNRKRVGRGSGSGHGKTSGRGHKGQKSRSGGNIPAWFEGGQLPLTRRLPIKGFTNYTRREYEVVNLSDLERSGLEGTVTIAVLRAAGIVTRSRKPVKILAMGEVTKALDLKINAISAKAREKIEAAGGTIELVK
ncbi:MAG: 50S ribosomal protein L15 [Candidatus Eisenbacteria sp.]|jgi:large subunit ribosomal protein L15|nr:50S ribosomal protein L15 [Candidatus Eisenbacteria bacterium]